MIYQLCHAKELIIGRDSEIMKKICSCQPTVELTVYPMKNESLVKSKQPTPQLNNGRK